MIRPPSRSRAGYQESLVGILRRRPCASQLLIRSERRTSEAAVITTVTTLEVLHRGGFDAEYSRAIARSALFTGVMLAMSEPGFGPDLLMPSESSTSGRRARLALLPPARFRRSGRRAGPMTDCDDPDFHHRLGTDMFIAGVRAPSEQVASHQSG